MFRQTRRGMLEALKDLDGSFETLNFAEHPFVQEPGACPVFQRLGAAFGRRLILEVGEYQGAALDG